MGTEIAVVTTTGDSGTGSLRSAIEYLNASGGNDSNIIQFAISGTIVVDPDNPLPVISRPVFFVMDGNAVEVKLQNATVIDGMPAIVLPVESNRAVTIPENLTLTVTGNNNELVLGSDTLLLNGMAGVLNTTVSSAGEATQNYQASGIVGWVDIIITDNLSGRITVTSDQSDSYGVVAINNITIAGSVTSKAEIIVTGINTAVGFDAQSGALSIGGDLSGKVTVHAQNYAYALYSKEDMAIGGLSGDISAISENSFSLGLYAEGELHGPTAQPLLISGTVSVVGWDFAAAIVAGRAMNLIISGTVSGITTVMNGVAFSIDSIPNDYDSVAVSDLITVTGTGKLVGNVHLSAGDDTMTLHAGADVIGVALLDGGSGTDRLGFSGNAVVGLDTQSVRVRNFEIIDLTDAKHNTLAISSADDVVKVKEADHDLSIVGDSGDRVRFSSTGPTFTSNESTTLDGVAYAHYISTADATVDLYVQSDLVVEFGDATAPTVTTFSPGDGTNSVAVNSDIVLTFSEAIQKCTGIIALHSSSASGKVVESYDVATSTNLTVSGSTLTINPTTDLAHRAHYFVTFDEYSISDLAGNRYAGTGSYDFITASPLLHTFTGHVTFWKSGAPVADVTSMLASMPVSSGTLPVEFRNIQVAADGSRTIELWKTSSKSDIHSLQLEFALPEGSVAAWKNASDLPSGWNSLVNTGTSGLFVLTGTGIRALSAESLQIGTLTLTVPTNPKHFDLSLSTGWLGNDAVPTLGTALDTMTTGADGLYQHHDMAAGTYMLSTTKASAANDKGAVDLLDAIAILKSIVGLTALNDYQQVAADFDKVNGVDLNDAIGILKHVVGLPAPTPEWVFVQGDATHNLADSITVDITAGTAVDLIGILRGDVDGSWVG